MFAQTKIRRSSPWERQASGVGPGARARPIRGAWIKYVDHPSFEDPTVRDAILAPLAGAVDDPRSRRFQPDGWLTPLPPGHSRANQVLSHEQETHLFRKMNFLKCRANQLVEQLDAERPSSRDLDELERLQSEATAIRSRIIEMNLGLVVSIARTWIRAGYGLSERISDANLALVQAVDGFDFARGNRFSTYATWAIRNVLVEHDRRFRRGRAQPLGRYEEFLASSNHDAGEQEIEEEHNRRRALVGRWLGRLDKRERRILASRHGIGGVPLLTLAQIGRLLDISKERVRQIEIRACGKLREFARREGLDTSDI
jgi:RNA polymerase primary sigma factor